MAARLVQVLASEGGSGTEVPELSIEVDDSDEALRRIDAACIAIAIGTGRPMSRGACGASTSVTQWVGSSTSFSTGSLQLRPDNSSKPAPVRGAAQLRCQAFRQRSQEPRDASTPSQL